MAVGERLDIVLVERGIAESRSKAQALILAGDVEVDGVRVTRAGHRVLPAHAVTLRARQRFVSRGGEKLQAALDAFAVTVAGCVCADIGASTGGFTDALLQAGAARVYAIDVGYGQLDLRLRNDPRVVIMDRVNARYLEELPEPVDFVSVDVSFISLSLILPVVGRLLSDAGECVALVKPQFEAGRREVGKKGVVRDPAIHRRVLESAGDWAIREGLVVRGLMRSPLKGPEGNIEFLLFLGRGEGDVDVLSPLIEPVLESGNA
ncbi:MAG: TlyA family RNA methyltransferase [Thermomicrobiales bacterium]